MGDMKEIKNMLLCPLYNPNVVLDWQYYTAQDNILVLNLKGIAIGMAKSKTFDGKDIHGDIAFYESLNYPTWYNTEIRVGENDEVLTITAIYYDEPIK